MRNHLCKLPSATLVTLMAFLGVSSASATLWVWDATPAQLGTQNNSGGQILGITSTYDDATDMFSWSATFANNPGNQTTGFTLAVSPGPNPKGEDGELALLYFDATGALPRLSVYAYNTKNDASSYKDGSKISGTQTPDRLLTSLNDVDSEVADLRLDLNADSTRTLAFTIDASLLNAHTPLYPGSEPWLGTQFANKIGVWFHPVRGLTTSYNEDGYLTNWSFKSQGWIDGENFNTVPEPASLALLALGTVGALLRRGRSAS